MDLHSMKFAFKIAAAAVSTLGVVFVMYVKFGEMSLKKRPVKHTHDSDRFKR